MAGQFQILQYRISIRSVIKDTDELKDVSDKTSYATYLCSRTIVTVSFEKVGNWPRLDHGSLPSNKDVQKLRRDLVMIIMRSNTPCCLTAYGFFIVSLETCTRVLSTAASYFTLLKGIKGRRNHINSLHTEFPLLHHRCSLYV
uniref:uncharacterized protein LOC117603978 n=1 Tax=Osmia lignaria TaxID=473952 RepID=UPI00147980EF|nr:uncharacterized protein LOC117603978 [Osmia lignaria]